MSSRKFSFSVVRDWGRSHIIQVRHTFSARGQMKVWDLTPAELLALYHTIGDYLVANREDFTNDETAGVKGIDPDSESMAPDGGLDVQGPR